MHLLLNVLSVLFCINRNFLIVATVLLTIGIKFYTTYVDLEIFLGIPSFSPAAIIISVAVILLVSSLFGYAAVLKESVCMVNSYTFMLTILLILEIAGAITAFIISNKTFSVIEDNMNGSLSQYSTNTVMQSAWDMAQQDFYCCGVHEPSDWAVHEVSGIVVNINNKIFHVPRSCCVEPKNCAKGAIYSGGCWGVLKSNISDATQILGYSVLNIVILQFIGIVFTGMLGKYLRRAKTLKEMDKQSASNKLYNQRQREVATLTQRSNTLFAPKSSEA